MPSLSRAEFGPKVWAPIFPEPELSKAEPNPGYVGRAEP
jgi:hypothetical protein